MLLMATSAGRSLVRLKLIYGKVGQKSLTARPYEDAEMLMAQNHDGNEYAFIDDEILDPLGELHSAVRYHRRASV